MLRFLITIIFISIPVNTFAAFASLNVSYDIFENPIFKDVHTDLRGIGKMLTLGFDELELPVQLIYKESNLEGLIKHDEREQNINQSSVAYGFRVGVRINNPMYLILGYMNHDIKYKFKGVSAYTEEGIRQTYKLRDKESSSVDYGLGYNLIRGNSTSLYVEYIIQNHSSISGSVHSINLGYRFRL